MDIVYTPREEAITNYQDYCDELGADRDSKRVFYEKMRQTPRVRDIQERIAGNRERVFEGIILKPEELAEEKQAILTNEKEVPKVPELPSSHTRDIEESTKKEQVEKTVNSGTPGTVNFEKTFINQCSDCGAILRYEGYPYGDLRLCKNCNLKSESQKKSCKKLTVKDRDPYCNWLNSIIGDKENCNSESCDGWEAAQ